MTRQGLSLRPAADKRRALRERLAERRLLIAPGVHDGVSARLADGLGFEALYMTGYGVVASALGLPDAGLATYSDMVGQVARLAALTDTPLICDGDTGYGGLLNVMHTVRGYEAAGASAIQLEDQEAPKKCGHMLGRRVIDAADMVEKIQVARETRQDPNFLIIARTDARTSLGLDEALRRAERYARAGADVLFVESTESEDELAQVCRSFDLPVVANLVEGGRSPQLDAARLEALGVRLALHPVAALQAALHAMNDTYVALRSRGDVSDASAPRYSFPAMSQLLGFDWIAEFDRRHARPTPQEPA